MKIHVKLYGVFRIGRFKEEKVIVPDGTRVQDLVEQLALSTALLGIILVNGRHSDAQCSLQDGDIVSLLPVLDGG
ncbi:MAG: molybdopterin synthase sulfur carrier subunit [Desulfuromonas sp.]|nr:MAG: molybdopterin synthase sulfur carrier subunit [Desulfuromonas sp.]